jgi:L-lactate permease
MQPWTQIYDPAGNLWLSSLVAAIPLIFFFLALTALRMKGHTAGFLTVLLALAVAVFFYGMPVAAAVMSVVQGFLFGLWPIAWIIVPAVFLYKLTVKSGQFEIIRASVVSVTDDQRLQMLMIGFSFGALLEGTAGFGTPVAITAAVLVGLGFNPLYAAGLCLIANTAPVAFGGLGIPIVTAGLVSGVDTFKIGAMAGRQLPLLAVFVPFWIVFVMDGWKGVKETWPAILVCGVSFALAVIFFSNFVGPELPDIMGSIISLVCVAVFLKFWKPKNVFRFNTGEQIDQSHSYTGGQVFKAWTPFLFLTAFIILWSLNPFKALFSGNGALAFTTINWQVPYLHNLVAKAPPIVASVKAIPAVYSWPLILSNGTAILAATIVAAIVLSIKASDCVKLFGDTVVELKWAIFTIGCVLAFGFIANASGLSTTLALLLVGAGKAYPFFSPLLGWLGVFLTGSDTSSNALFAALQATTATQLNIPDVLLVAANSTGGVAGKMISPQSIAVACAAVGLIGHESGLFRFTLKHSIFFVLIISVITTLQAYVFTGMVP